MSAASSGGDARQIGHSRTRFTNFTWTHDGRLIDDKDGTLNWVNPDSGAKGVVAPEPDAASGDPSRMLRRPLRRVRSSSAMAARAARRSGARTPPGEI